MLESKSGSRDVPVKVTDEMTPGDGRAAARLGPPRRLAARQRAGGVNVNLLASGRPEDLERLAGMAFLNGIPVRVSPLAAAPGAAEDARPEPAGV